MFICQDSETLLFKVSWLDRWVMRYFQEVGWYLSLQICCKKNDDNMELPFDLRDWKQTHAAFLLIKIQVFQRMERTEARFWIVSQVTSIRCWWKMNLSGPTFEVSWCLLHFILLECKARVTCAHLGELACSGFAIKYRAVWSAESCMAHRSCKLRTVFEIAR